MEAPDLEKQIHYLIQYFTNQIYLYAKDPYEVKYQLLINKWERTGLMYLNDSKAVIEYSNGVDNIYKNTEER